MRTTKVVSAVSLACVIAILASAYRPAHAGSDLSQLRVCADPNNLPFSNDKQQGFENRIAELVARDLGAKLSYVWWAQRRGFVRNTINQNQCDVLIGVPASFERTRPTIPYYRSTYVFVTRRDRHLKITSFDDRQLKRLRIGVQLIGDDGINTPPAHALSNRGIIRNVRGYSVYGDYRQPNPPARIVDAVANGEIDVAVVWGPLAGYFARREPVALDLTPVSPQIDLPFLPFVFDISMGVRRGNDTLRERLNAVIERRRVDIDRILDQYGVPRVDVGQPGSST
ncbi:MAG TPA: substrate-binding domain-containing protein [Gemmatimonadaceae bacterium]|nr:substrate-binding domain-containing protein [Gemmatimonadaceae bacterium]